MSRRWNATQPFCLTESDFSMMIFGIALGAVFFEVKETGFVNGARDWRLRFVPVCWASVTEWAVISHRLHTSLFPMSQPMTIIRCGTSWYTLTDSMEPDFGAYNEVALAQNRLAAEFILPAWGLRFYRRERKRRVRNTVTTTAIAPRRR